MKKVKELMTPKVLNIESSASMQEVIRFFAHNDISHAVVTDNVGIYKGIISKTDLVNKMNYLLKETSSQTYTRLEMENQKARDIMTRITVNLKPEDTIDYATEILLQNRFHSLPVINNFRAVGIVTKHDLLKGYYEQVAYSQNLNYE